ncbi:MAG TPA: DinB family protein [Bryobacteraceae bacterium]|nr:DinB family protein [Bryobacteraceae bacterium]
MRFAVLLLWVAGYAQVAPSNEQIVKEWQMSKEFTLAVADAMPADQYGFKVADGEMSFAALMIHIASSQSFRFAQVAGVPNPLEVPKELPKGQAKAIAMDLLRKSFDYCIGQLGKFTPEQLARTYKLDWYERPEATGREILLGMFVHTAHHRAQAEVYERAKGITPPVYRF